MAKTSAIWQHAALIIDQLSSRKAFKQEPYKKAYLLTKNTEEFSGRKISGECTSRQKEKKRKREDRKSNGSRQKN